MPAMRLLTLAALVWVLLELKGLRKQMAEFDEDEQRLETDVQQETALIGQVKSKLDDDSTQIAALKGQVTTLQGQGVDTTAMETALSALEANNQSLTAALPAPAAASA